MGLLWWMVIGLVAGILAKALMPGEEREPKGCLLTMLLGMAGSVVMGFLTTLLLGGGSGSFLGSVIGATIGAMLIIWIARRASGPSRR